MYYIIMKYVINALYARVLKLYRTINWKQDLLYRLSEFPKPFHFIDPDVARMDICGNTESYQVEVWVWCDVRVAPLAWAAELWE